VCVGLPTLTLTLTEACDEAYITGYLSGGIKQVLDLGFEGGVVKIKHFDIFMEEPLMMSFDVHIGDSYKLVTKAVVFVTVFIAALVIAAAIWTGGQALALLGNILPAIFSQG